MKISEVIRIIIWAIAGMLIILWLQPWLYQRNIISVSDVPVDAWLQNDYMTGAAIVCMVSLLSTILWYILAAAARTVSSRDVLPWQVVWWVLFLYPVLSICAALYFFNRSQEALPLLTGFYIFDIFFLYWLPTATSSPRNLMYVPPGAFFIRRIIGC